MNLKIKKEKSKEEGPRARALFAAKLFTPFFFLTINFLIAASGTAKEEQSPYFAITVVDDQTGRGVPLVELRTVSEMKFYTDSNGVVAFNEPGLMDRAVFFHVKSHGYEFPADGFGTRGVSLNVKAGGSA